MSSSYQHARLSPSASERWTSCTASPSYLDQVKDKLPPDKGSVDADLGTTQHSWNEKLLLGKVTLSQIPEEHRPWAEMWQDHTLSLTTGIGQSYVEAKIPLFYSPEENGTVDWAYVKQEPERVVYIRDYKHGIGVPVSPVENSQLSIYAQSLIVHLKSQGVTFDPSDKVSIGVVQPRYRGDDPIKVWDTTVGELAEFCEYEVQFAVDLIKANHVEFRPSLNACRWCQASAICAAKNNAIFAPIPVTVNPMVEFDNLEEFKEVKDALTDKNVLDILTHADHIKTFLNDVETYAYNRAISGSPLEGTKLVMGREGNRQWLSEEQGIRFLRSAGLKADSIYTKSIISLPQAEKLVKDVLKTKPKLATRFAKLTTRTPAKKVIALEADHRPAVSPEVSSVSVDEFNDLTAVDDFDDLTA